LENQRKELHLLLDSMHSAIWYLDRWGMIKDSNVLAQKLIGDAATGKNFIEVAHFWDDPTHRERDIMEVIRTGQPLLKSIESLHLDGAQRWFTVDKIPTLDDAGQVSGLLLVMTDITDNLIKERALEESEARYKAFIANSSEAIWCYDMIPPVDTTSNTEQQVVDIAQSARLSECNNVLVRMLGAEDINEILGSGLVESGSQNYLFDLHHFVEKHYQLIDHDIVREDRKGRRLCYQISCVGVVENGLLRRVWGTTKDITARKRYEDRLEYQSTHDALTKLPNRVKLYREIDHWMHHREDDHLCALMLIDLDRFKEINDTLGHQVGDRLLQLIGPRLETEMSEMPGMIARLGGDEFAIFLPRIRNQRQAIVFGHRVLDALRQEFDVEGFCTEISASIGISLCPTQAQDVSTMMRYADVAMYRAKTEMSGLSLYNAEYDPHSPKRLALMGELGRAIREDQLCLYFQPKVSLESNSFYGFEALLRWNHPELGFVPPGEFIPIVEMTSLIHPMTAWVLEKSIEQCRLWHDQGLAVTVAVNLSARNLLDENMPKQVMRLLQQYQLPPKYLELEITESSIMTDPHRAMRVLDQLHDLGVLLAIDDFGTGYSSLAYLKRLPVQTLKIDYSFVRNMLEDKQDEVIVNSTIHLAHNLGLRVVAEGVENEELLRRLDMMGCDDAQGYHIGRPMPADKVDEWVSSSDWAKKFSRNSISLD
jgi:diguanylate cyclase (GGDEF)-like protein/PAS domain S-box-containing protein